MTTGPCSADSGGSKVFTALNAATSARTTARPTARSRRNDGERLDLGQLGHVRPVLRPCAVSWSSGKLTPVVAWQR